MIFPTKENQETYDALRTDEFCCSICRAFFQAGFSKSPGFAHRSDTLACFRNCLQTFGKVLLRALHGEPTADIDRIVNSLPVMRAQHGHSYSARVAREVADAGFCAAKKTHFHGVRLHVIAERHSGRVPKPAHIWLREVSAHDSKAFVNQPLQLPDTTLFGDLAYPTRQIIAWLKKQNTTLIAPKKKPKGKKLTELEKYHNRLVSKFRQPIESLFNWIIEKTSIQKASKVRSTVALMIHCWGKLAFAFFLLVFYY